MIFPRAPRFPLSSKPVVVQVVSQKQGGAVDPRVLIVENKAAVPAQADIAPPGKPPAE